MAAHADRGVPLSTLCPKFLHTNSTSHTWPFSAIAELIDNAYDPDVCAKQFWIDKTVIKGEECLSFMDNGNGLDHETMHKMLSFGYSDKTVVNGVAPIGIYGNGFKSGSMRLGRDAIVFSKSKSSLCVGMLSQTYLEKIGAEQIVVPIVCFVQMNTSKFSVQDEHKASLQDILRYSPFSTQAELLTELGHISPPWSTEKTGTRIIIWNLRKTSAGTVEFDFEKDRYDIQIPSDVYEAVSQTPQHPNKVTSYVPESVFSLRAYCSVLYLKPRMQVIIRGQKVKSQLIAKSLAFIRKDRYKPNFLDKHIPITFGYNTKSKDHYGVMMYHKNRLIKAYERVGCQLKGNNQGVGVIGVVECNFLDPTHNKQSFMDTDHYRRTTHNLGIKLEEYWKEIRFRRNKDNPDSTTPVEDAMKRPDQNWVQCDDCLQWRKLPDGIDVGKLPEKWFCRMNPDPQFRSCQVEEEPEDSDDDQPSYCKTYKQQEKEDKRLQEKKRQKDEEERRREEEQRLDNLARQNEALKRQKEDLKRQLRQTTVRSPPTPATPRTRFNSESRQGGAARAESSPLRSSAVSQAACSPSSSSGLPVISNVRSLAAGPHRGKRRQPVTPQTTPKRPRVNGVLTRTSNTPSSVVGSPLCSPSVDDDDDGDDDDTDDDIVILEAASTPRPKKPLFDLSTVKTEPCDADVGMLSECSGDAAAADVAAEANAAGAAAQRTGPSPAPAPGLTSSTTQTEAPKVKREEEEHDQTGGNGGAGQSTSDMSDDCSRSEQRVIKQESEEDAQSGNREQHTPQSGGTHYPCDEAAGPSHADACDKKVSPLPQPSMTEVQEQQDRLLELMQETAQERDFFREQVDKLTCQLQDMESRLHELSQVSERECAHQASQTEETEGGNDYKALFGKAKQKVDQLIKDKEALLAAAETKPSTGRDEERDTDEIALQVDYLMRELDQRNKEKDELRSKLDSLEEERANLAAQCEELRLSLQQQRENAQEGSTAAHRDAEEAEGTAASGTDSGSDTFRSLVALRQNIGRILVTYVPDLELSQVNYECNVIDEILEQVLYDEELARAVEESRQSTK